MEKLNRAAKCSILGPQNLGSGGGPGPPGPPPGSAAGLYRFVCQGVLPSSLSPSCLSLTAAAPASL